ncbi:hypothetical protein PI126_g4756 [Phytophthora idaei]|nr:hypothetical protein PI126_g4756 [Phytophthora idaei]
MLARGKRLNSARKARHESYPHRADKWDSEETPERDGLEHLLCEEYGLMLERISTTYTYKDPVSMKTFICSRLSELQTFVYRFRSLGVPQIRT